MSLITASHHPPLTATPETTVYDACLAMGQHNVGAVAVMQGDQLAGILTERDVLKKVVAQKKNPENVQLREVMTSPCQTISADLEIEDALAIMVSKTIHHLAVVDENGKLAGLVSYRTLMSQKVSTLDAEVDHLSAYMGSDGIGGD